MADEEQDETEDAEEKEQEEDLELDEKTLEDLTETEEPEQEQEIDNFSEFMVASSEEMPTPTLQTSPVLMETSEGAEPTTGPEATGPGTLEETSVPTMPGTMPGVSDDETETGTVFNEPEYTAGASEETLIRDLEESQRFLRTAEQVREIQPRVVMDRDELKEIRQEHQRQEGRLKDYVEIGRREETERRLPFERKEREYRTLKK